MLIRPFLLLGMMTMVGCAGRANKPNHLAASNFVKAHPRMQQICDAAGGCQKVTLTCSKYDSGNDALAGHTFWHIEAEHIVGIGEDGYGEDALESAIDDWLSSRPSVSHPCDQECINKEINP